MKNRRIIIGILMLVSFCMLASFASALPIEITDPLPANQAVGVGIDASLFLHSTVNSSNGSAMMGSMWTNASGSFVWSNWAGPFTNTTMNWNIDASNYSTKYWWGVYVNDSWGNSLNQSWNFTTEDAPVAQTISHQLGFVGDAAKVLLGVVMMVIVSGVLYLELSTFFDKKKKKNFKTIIETMVMVIIAVALLAVIASLIITF